MATVRTITSVLAKLAPEELAYDWDNVGLLLGDYSREVKRVLLALEITEEVVTEALEKSCELIITHHPLIFQPLKKINTQHQLGKILQQALVAGLNIYTAHTNLDLAVPGLNDYLAELLGLDKCQPLQIMTEDQNYKLVVFIPREYYHQVKDAIWEAGAGFIGNYSHTSFRSKGTGTFKPLAASDPFLGKRDELTEVEEIRFETIVTERSLQEVIKTMLAAHPYEEVAYDLYPLANQGKQYGLGRIGRLKEKLRLDDYLPLIKAKLALPSVKYVGRRERLIERVAVCSGSGADLIRAASDAGADLYITGDIKYHDAQLAEQIELGLVEAGHYETEIIVRDFLNNYLTGKLSDVALFRSTINTNPWSVF